MQAREHSGLFLLLAVCFVVLSSFNVMAQNFSCVDYPIVMPSEVVHSYLLGETTVNVTTYTQPSANGEAGLYSFINLHENENTSVVAAKTLIYQKGGGSITFLQHGGTRDINFIFQGNDYSIDPNRMFTWEGLQANLMPSFNEDAAAAVLEFSQEVLNIYEFSNRSVVLALHNDSPNYSALEYLPGGPYAEEAAKVHIGVHFTPRDFFYIANGVVGSTLYNCLTEEGFNAVLQVPYVAPNSTLTNDGSLSVYAAMNGKPYVNTEAAAACCSQGTAVVNQLILLDHLTTQVAQIQ